VVGNYDIWGVVLEVSCNLYSFLSALDRCCGFDPMALVRLLASLLAFLALESVVNELLHGRPHRNMMPTIPMVEISGGRVMSHNGTEIPSLNPTYYFLMPKKKVGDEYEDAH
jgi:hypothetical protein